MLHNKKFKKLFTLIAVFAFLFGPKTAGVLFAAAPTVTTGSASSITRTSARLNGMVPNNGGEIVTEVGYNYGLTSSYGNTISANIDYGSGSSIIAGAFGAGDGEFYSPTSLALDSSGNIYTLDTSNGRVQKFNSDGVYQSQFGTPGFGDGEFGMAYDVAIDSVGNIYIIDFNPDGSRVQKFNSAGLYQSQFGSYVFTGEDYGTPLAISIDSADNIYVAYNVFPNQNHIRKFDSNGNYISQFGSGGTGNGEFGTVTDMAIDSADNIYIIDSDLQRIQKFNSDGVYQLQFGTLGVGNGQFNMPGGIAIDSNDNIFVTDSYNYRVQKFNSSGVYQAQFSLAYLPNAFLANSYIPSRVIFDSDDSFYVLTNRDGVGTTVEKFSLTMMVPTEISPLACETTYHFRAYAENVDGVGYGNDSTFQTADCLPLATPNKEPHTPVRPPRRPITDKPESRKPETSRPTIVGAEEIKVVTKE